MQLNKRKRRENKALGKGPRKQSKSPFVCKKRLEGESDQEYLARRPQWLEGYIKEKGIEFEPHGNDPNIEVKFWKVKKGKLAQERDFNNVLTEDERRERGLIRRKR